MLLSDGSVTRHLQIMTGAKVAVVSKQFCLHCSATVRLQPLLSPSLWPYLQECTQMQVLEDCTGLPSSTEHINQPLLQRQVAWDLSWQLRLPCR